MMQLLQLLNIVDAVRVEWVRSGSLTSALSSSQLQTMEGLVVLNRLRAIQALQQVTPFTIHLVDCVRS